MSPSANAQDTDSIPGQGRFHMPCHRATKPVSEHCLQKKQNQINLPLTGHGGLFLRAFKEAAGQTI